MPSEPLLKNSGADLHYGPIQALHGISLGSEFRRACCDCRRQRCRQDYAAADAVWRAEGIRWKHLVSTAQRLPGWPPTRSSSPICHVPEGRQAFAPLEVEDNLKLGAYCFVTTNAG